MRLLGIDAGEKKIGIALSDKLNITALPLTVLENDAELRANLSNIIKKYNVGKIIIGIPYNLKGEKGYQAIKVEDFIKNNLMDLAEETGLDIIRVDERFTSKISGKILSKKTVEKPEKRRTRGFRKLKSRSSLEIDCMSAAILLNDYIEKIKADIQDKKD